MRALLFFRIILLFLCVSCNDNKKIIVNKWYLISMGKEGGEVIPIIEEKQPYIQFNNDKTYEAFGYVGSTGYWEIINDSLYLDDKGFKLIKETDTKLKLVRFTTFQILSIYPPLVHDKTE